MAQIRVRPNGRIQFDFHLYGQRFREGTKMMATPKNMKIAQTRLKKINAEIALGTFEYREHFPLSKKVALFETLRREKLPEHHCPYFDTFASQWYERQKQKWKQSYQRTVWLNLQRYLLPEFSNILVNEITLEHVELFRNTLLQEEKNGKRRLSNRRINNIFWPLVAILSLAADEYKFEYPLRRYKALREEKADASPMTTDEVRQFLDTVPEQWKAYFIVRFWTGMRSCEAHGLEWQHVDFAHRLIHIRQNYVNGELGDVKTPSSRRSLTMCDTLYQTFRHLYDQREPDNPFVFTHPNGSPLDTHYVSKKIWYPTLEKAGLKRRRPYETRHTAAVLHIAAHENPLYISHMLGHSSSRLLFEVYAPYVANASRSDGQAFNTMMAKEGLA